jgi:L-aminopeptidase/D-esterase-like protein
MSADSPASEGGSVTHGSGSPTAGRGSITDVPGIRVGHATDAAGLTGCTAVLCDTPAVGGVVLRGWANAVHGVEFLDPRHIVPTLDGVLLAGGSAYGLEAVWGVMRYLEERGVGFRAGPTVVPHVASAILFDLNIGDMRARPTREMGYWAAASASRAAPAEGSVGAGTGATVGKLYRMERAMRGGTGTASVNAAGVTVGALVVVNAVGDVRDPNTGTLVAGAREAHGGCQLIDTAAAMRSGVRLPEFATENTTIGVVATDARLTKAEAAKVAELGMVGFARALSPPHTAVDGDTLFTLSLGDARADVTTIGMAAAEAVATAITRAVRLATSVPGVPAARDLVQ